MNLEIELANRNKRFKFKTESIEIQNFIFTHFRVKNSRAKYSKFADPFICPITATGSFKAGFGASIITAVKERFPQCEITLSKDVESILKPFSYVPKRLVQVPNKTYKIRDYQQQAVFNGLLNGRGIFEMATGSGKSLVITTLILNIWELMKSKKTVLLLVPNIQLVRQMHSDMLDYGIPEADIQMFSSFSKDRPKAGRIICSNRQWLEKHFDELPPIDIVMIDECHGLKKGNGVSDMVDALETDIRFGFTGTLPEEKEHEWHVKGICGGILYEKKAKELQEEVYIAQININAIKIDHCVPQPQLDDPEANPLDRAKARFPLEWKYIEGSLPSNRVICKIAGRLQGNTIILFDHTEHGRELERICHELNLDKEIFFINGEVKLDYREDVRTAMESKTNNIVIGNTKCIGTGTNIKSIDNIIFAFSSGTAAPKIIQACGRGLRLKKGKTKVTLYDFYHSFKYSKQHFHKRLKLYKANYKIKSFKHKEINLLT